MDIQQQNAQFMCLDLLLAFVNDMAARMHGVGVLFSLRTGCLTLLFSLPNLGPR